MSGTPEFSPETDGLFQASQLSEIPEWTSNEKTMNELKTHRTSIDPIQLPVCQLDVEWDLIRIRKSVASTHSSSCGEVVNKIRVCCLGWFMLMQRDAFVCFFVVHVAATSPNLPLHCFCYAWCYSHCDYWRRYLF